MRFNEIVTPADIESRKKQLGIPVKPGFYVIYRACPIDVTEFKEMDYVTMSKKFAIGHADHMAVTEEESYHVIKKMVDNKKEPTLRNASNPGEYFYVGPDLKGNVIYVAEEFG